MSLSKLLANGSTASAESGQNTDSMTASFSSQPPLTGQFDRSDEEFHEGPVLPNIIVQRYEGEKFREQFHGEGVAHFQGGHVYKGMFSEGLMNGRGLYTWADGVKYEGEFASNVPMGHGTYTWLDGSCYEGEVCNGIRHGLGTFRCANASVVYRGQWHHGKRNGKGTIYYNQEMTSLYEGDWVNNNREGWGVRCYPSGNVYEGQWKSNVMHEGKMRWLQLGQQYNGRWENGVQHGQGTHTWFLNRVPGSQYPLRNEYAGDFVQGLRHGQGSFYYASGALYKGEWKCNKKHGQGKFIFKNGRIFEGEFVDDHMAEFPAFCMDGAKTPDLSVIRTHSPCPEDGESPRRVRDSDSGPSQFGPDMALDIGILLEKLPEKQRDQEFKQVQFAVVRHIAELRSIYSFYSSLGHDQSPDNTFLLSRLQFWRFLKDCRVHQHGITLAQADRFISEDVPPEEIHSPFSTMLLREFLSRVVVLAYNTYHKEIESSDNILVVCFCKLMRENIIPNANNVKGLLFCNPLHAVIAVNYIERCWEIYQAVCRVNTPLADFGLTKWSMTIRHFIWMFKDLRLFNAERTTGKLLEILSAENLTAYDPCLCNLDLEMTFLEFFEALLGCAEVKGRQTGQTCMDSEPGIWPQADSSKVSPGEIRESPLQSTRHHSPLAGPTVKSSNPNICPDVSSAKSVEMGKSKEILPLSTPEDMEAKQSPKAAANLKSPTGEMGGGSATHSSDTDWREDSGGAPVISPVSALEAKGSSNPPHPPSTEPGEERGGAGEAPPPESELDGWIQRTHIFFNQTFFPAYEYSLLLRREVEEERLRQKAHTRTALAKAKEQARLREQWEAEEERRREEEEDEEAERPDGVDDDHNPLSPVETPVASATSVAVPKQSSATGAKKKKK